MGFVDIYGPRVPRAERYGGHGLFTFSAQSLTVRLLRVVRCGGNDGEVLLWDCPFLFAVCRIFCGHSRTLLM